MSAVVEQIVLVDEWRGLYGESWKGVIVDDAFAHPAKFSRALIRKIYDHVIAEGWATKGDSVVDPFGGVALGGFDAMRHGLNWTGCELEQKFVELGGQNIALWNERFSRMPNWGRARLVQGDSRKLGDVLHEASCCVSSPPYADFGQNQGTDNKRDLFFSKKQGDSANVWRDGYGQTEGQLGAMKEGDHSIAISSPPYINSVNSHDHGIDWSKVGPATGNRKRGKGSKHEETLRAQMAYTKDPDPANLGAMPEGQLCVSSPPFEKGAEGNLRAAKFKDPVAFATAMQAKDGKNGRHGVTLQARIQQLQKQNGRTYGDNPDNVGNQSGETFWSASRLILEQLHQVLAPNAHAVFVVKAFVRDKKIVGFPARWAQLCEAVGFKLLHDHHALLTEHYGTQGGFESDKKLSVERKSFFRRLAESKGSPRIDHESVLCFRRSA